VKPRTSSSPDVVYSRPESIFSVVVLPAPFGPSRPTTSPRSMLNVIVSTASLVSYVRRTKLLIAPPRPACCWWNV
jgi:hypothetical protein